MRFLSTTALVAAALLALACGGDEARPRTRTVTDNDMCLISGGGGLAGDPCESPEDCALNVCCDCPDIARSFAAAACRGDECMAAEDVCQAVFDNDTPVCD